MANRSTNTTFIFDRIWQHPSIRQAARLFAFVRHLALSALRSCSITVYRVQKDVESVETNVFRQRTKGVHRENLGSVKRHKPYYYASCLLIHRSSSLPRNGLRGKNVDAHRFPGNSLSPDLVHECFSSDSSAISFFIGRAKAFYISLQNGIDGIRVYIYIYRRGGKIKRKRLLKDLIVDWNSKSNSMKLSRGLKYIYIYLIH